MEIQDNVMDWTLTTTTCPGTHRIAVATVCFPSAGPTPNRRRQHCMCTSRARKNNHNPLTRLFCCADLETQRPATLFAQPPGHVLGLPSRRQISNTTPKLHVHTRPQSFASTTRAEHNRHVSGRLSRCRSWRVLCQSSRSKQTPRKASELRAPCLRRRRPRRL